MNLSGHWKISRYVLLVERRRCECGECFISPALFPRVELVDPWGNTQTCGVEEVRKLYGELEKLIRREFAMPILPRVIRYIDVAVTVCPHCFTEVSVDEPDLFPSHSPLELSSIYEARDIATALVTSASASTSAPLTSENADVIAEIALSTKAARVAARKAEAERKRELARERRAKARKAKAAAVVPLDLSNF